jgi:hypothetical protein
MDAHPYGGIHKHPYYRAALILDQVTLSLGTIRSSGRPSHSPNNSLRRYLTPSTENRMALKGELSARTWARACEAWRIIPGWCPSSTSAPTRPRAPKRSLLGRYSLLVLNKEIVDDHTDAWNDQDIVTRGRDLTTAILALWPRGSASMSSIRG